MTYLQLVNNVLRRLRESQVSSVSGTSYGLLIGEFVNDAKREIEDSWNWQALRSLVSVSTVADTATVTLTGTNDRSRVLAGYETSSGNDHILRPISAEILTRYQRLGTLQTQIPSRYRVSGLSSGELVVSLWPTPDAVYTVEFRCVIPQADLSADGDELTIPDAPVFLGAWARALIDRGDDATAQFAAASAEAERVKAQAIIRDISFAQEEMDYVVV